jgi:D12 class N6 adenine-specific DNA methyltransferase
LNVTPDFVNKARNSSSKLPPPMMLGQILNVKPDGVHVGRAHRKSAVVFFALPQRAVLGDVNGELIRTYLEVKHRPLPLARALTCLRRFKKTYLAMGKRVPDTLSVTDRAARFIYLNRFCFNGLYRTNLLGEFNVPYGATGTGSLPSGEQNWNALGAHFRLDRRSLRFAPSLVTLIGVTPSSVMRALRSKGLLTGRGVETADPSTPVAAATSARDDKTGGAQNGKGPTLFT